MRCPRCKTITEGKRIQSYYLCYECKGEFTIPKRIVRTINEIADGVTLKELKRKRQRGYRR